MESLLRHAPASSQTEATPDAEVYAAPETSALSVGPGAQAAIEESLKTSVQDSSESGEAKVSANSGKSPRLTVASNDARAKAVPASSARPVSGSRSVWQVAALALLFVAVGAVALAFYFSHGKGNAAGGGDAPISLSDQQRRVEENLAEADRLLADGKVTDAIARLRYAVKLDPSNARAHRMLADALERTGNVNEAIDEYRAAVESDSRDEDTRLRYADALRRVGRVDEAREIYQKLSASSTEEVTRTAKEKLAQMPATASSTDSAETREARAQNRAGEGEANTSGNGVSSSGSTTGAENSGAAGKVNSGGKGGNDPVSSYNRAMKIIEGKDIKKMNRADLILAYTLFQYAQRGPNKAEADRHVRELDNELFVRRKRKQ
jgi:tetratricopeptide (TPR) repeat protein